MFFSRLFSIGLFFLGISSLGFTPVGNDPWNRPKLILILISLLIISLSSIFSLERMPKLREIPRHGLAFLFFSFYLIFHATLFQYSLLQLVYLLPLFFLVSLILILQDEKKTEPSMFLQNSLTLVFVIHAVVAIVKFFFFKKFGFQQMGDALKWRTLGLVGNPNQLALLLSVYFLRPASLWWEKRWQKVCSAMVCLALMLTFSRGAFIALFFALFFRNDFSLSKNHLKQFIIPVILLISFVLFIEVFYGPTGIFNIASLTGREASYIAFFKSEHLNTFSFFFGSGDWDMLSPIHNQFLFIFKYFGLAGLFFFIFFLKVFLKTDRQMTILLIIFSLYDLPLLNPAFISLLLYRFLVPPHFWFRNSK